jgi:hypothetical protein
MTNLQDAAQGLRCPNCLKTGTIVCHTVEMKGFPTRYTMTCKSCLYGIYPCGTPLEAREAFLECCRFIPPNKARANDNKLKQTDQGSTAEMDPDFGTIG